MKFELDKISKSYAMKGRVVEVLKQISLCVREGELVALVGPSGCGKSTTMGILGLLDTPTSGDYQLDGISTLALTADERAHFRNRYIGFVFQHFYLLPRLSALDNVALPLTYRHLSHGVIKEKAMDALAQVELAHLSDYKPNELSGGQQQRVAIARAIVGKPSLILADEPTGSVDSKTGQSLMDLFIDFNRRRKTTIMIVTHDRSIAKQCDRSIEMHDGTLLTSGLA